MASYWEPETTDECLQRAADIEAGRGPNPTLHQLKLLSARMKLLADRELAEAEMVTQLVFAAAARGWKFNTAAVEVCAQLFPELRAAHADDDQDFLDVVQSVLTLRHSYRRHQQRPG